MINVNDAKNVIISNLPKLYSEQKSLLNSAYHILAEDIYSDLDLPHFNNSAVDGYGISSLTYHPNKKYTVTKEISAGLNFNEKIGNHESVRIFTGAKVPDYIDTIIMQEYAFRDENTVWFDPEFVKPGSHIRKQGEQLRSGDLVLKKGTLLNPFTIGFLANLGMDNIQVFKKPDVGMIISGSELVQVGNKLVEGQIYESNGIMLGSALKSYGFKSSYQCIGDDEVILNEAFKSSINSHDVIIFTGGASVGDYDFTARIIEKNGFNIVFNKINQKPGKPMIFGVKKSKVVFGLPGNPRAAFICFYEYVLPALKSMMGANRPFLETIKLPLKNEYQRKDDKKTYFLNAIFDHEGVEILGKQQSDMLQTAAIANCIAILNGEQISVSKGSLIEVHILPKS